MFLGHPLCLTAVYMGPVLHTGHRILHCYRISQFNMSIPRFISRSPVYIGSSHGEEIDPIDLSSLTSCPITPMVTVPAEELVLLIQL